MRKENELRPWLVQRLRKPYKYLPEDAGDLISYYRNCNEIADGDHAEQKKLIAQYPAEIDNLCALVVCDLMGAAEFEWGAVPRGLMEMCLSRAEMVPVSMQVTGKPAYMEHMDAQVREQLIKENGAGIAEREVTLSGWCKPEHKEQLMAFLKTQASGEEDAAWDRLKELTQLQAGCFGFVLRDPQVKNYKVVAGDVVGWMDLTNLWFVSLDPSLVRDLAHLLGVKV